MRAGVDRGAVAARRLRSLSNSVPRACRSATRQQLARELRQRTIGRRVERLREERAGSLRQVLVRELESRPGGDEHLSLPEMGSQRVRPQRRTMQRARFAERARDRCLAADAFPNAIVAHSAILSRCMPRGRLKCFALERAPPFGRGGEESHGAAGSKHRQARHNRSERGADVRAGVRALDEQEGIDIRFAQRFTKQITETLNIPIRRERDDERKCGRARNRYHAVRFNARITAKQ